MGAIILIRKNNPKVKMFISLATIQLSKKEPDWVQINKIRYCLHQSIGKNRNKRFTITKLLQMRIKVKKGRRFSKLVQKYFFDATVPTDLLVRNFPN